MIQLVFAHCNGIFGYKSELPWTHVPGDLANFKRITTDTILVMGPKTFMSLPGKLPGRDHIVLTEDTKRDTSTIVAKDGSKPDSFMGYNFLSLEVSDNLYSIIGGAELLLQAFDYADIVHITEIDQRFLKHEIVGNNDDIIRLSDHFLKDLYYIDMQNFKNIKSEKTNNYTFNTWTR